MIWLFAVVFGLAMHARIVTQRHKTETTQRHTPHNVRARTYKQSFPPGYKRKNSAQKHKRLELLQYATSFLLRRATFLPLKFGHCQPFLSRSLCNVPRAHSLGYVARLPNPISAWVAKSAGLSTTSLSPDNES